MTVKTSKNQILQKQIKSEKISTITKSDQKTVAVKAQQFLSCELSHLMEGMKV